MFRWVVEAVNGRVKNVFPFFKHTIEGSCSYVPKIIRFNRIACVINKYFPPLLFSNQEFHDIISEAVSTPILHISQTNKLKEQIEQLGLKRMMTRWEKASESSVVDFPKLSMEDLKRITLGTYQLKTAKRYIEHHMKESSEFGIFIHRENAGLIRARIQSRFSWSKTHDAWVKFEKTENGYVAIKGLYCTCKVGERTLGCCSHLTSIVRYLGFDRHQPENPKTYSRLAWDAIDCNAIECNDSDTSDDENEF